MKILKIFSNLCKQNFRLRQKNIFVKNEITNNITEGSKIQTRPNFEWLKEVSLQMVCI